jgi:NitT/TauT family transport system permease protein
MNTLTGVFSPNRAVSKDTARLIIGTQVCLLLVFWFLSPRGLMPKPGEVWESFSDLFHNGMVSELMTSFFLNVQAMIVASIVSLGLAYSTVFPFMRPIVTGISKLRFLSLAGLTLLFTVMTTSGHQLKLSLMVYSVSVFFVTSMVDVILSIPKEKFDLARTLRMGEYQVIWEAIILGRIDVAFDVLRQNAAIGWMMLTMIEGMVRSEGGIGTVLLNQSKHFDLAAIMAIQISILGLGLFQDYMIGVFKNIACPYSSLILERR